MSQVFHHVYKFLKRLDKALLLMCIAASVFSIFLLYTMHYNNVNPAVVSSRTWKMQALAAGTGLTIALSLSAISYRFLSKVWYVPAGIALTLSLLLFTPLGKRTGEAADLNWLDLGIIEVQPSAFMLVAFILTMSTHLSYLNRDGENKMNQLHHMALLCLHAMVPMGLLTLQKDTGTTIIFTGVFLIMLFLAGLSWKYIVALGVASPIAGVVLWNLARNYQMTRILVLIDPEVREAEMLGIYYHQHSGLIALNSGGLTGQGFTGGEYTYLFAVHNDFIFAYIGMVAGFVGCLLAVLLLLSICTKVLTVGSVSRDYLGRMICCGVFAMFFFHMVINVAMVTAVGPVVGVQLPFYSAGGSSTLAQWIAVGLVLSVWGHRKREYHMFYEEED
ncbi:MAG: FtsW/RodA/SpoVE family cell cycle protein [Oscillospiraceae bacterium]|nr:FtsW/RodA/SpoVE family cell cycle protein [Oscillospiraceae bacterium]